ncbi:hypothetical protein GL4_0491 [Methyloceanibacter caenitepidi]|uniref:Uncharacterized protein n=1 Tax=Methyloceanibacter caenitepidi TaxID=1384459 RepID=A0A0A8K0D0_9HYPH|nr:hypothetical protein GL4_0491 [Methyloceanibacter caenitepidi]
MPFETHATMMRYVANNPSRGGAEHGPSAEHVAPDESHAQTAQA